MRALNLTIAVLMIFAVAACAPAPQGSHDSPEISAAAKAWNEALNAGDIESIVALYTEDARILPPNAEIAQGHDAVRKIFGGMIDAGLGGTLGTIEATAAGDIGYRVGTYVLETADGTVADKGKYIETWRLVDGSWKISNDVYNSDLPAMAPTGTTLVITHEVEDSDRWLAAWQGENSRRELFAEHGAPSVRVFQSPENPNLTGLLIEVEDMEALQALLSSDAGKDAKAEDGVKDATMRVLAEVE
jgi:ketosteroid isomerase-like protein